MSLHPWALRAWVYREHSSLTAAATNLGVSKSSLSGYVNGKARIPEWIQGRLGDQPTPKSKPTPYPRACDEPKNAVMSPRNFAAIRRRLGLTGKLLGEALGVSKCYVSMCERGRRKVSARIAERVLGLVAGRQAA